MGKANARPDRAGFGARHKVVYGGSLRKFYEGVSEAWSEYASTKRSYADSGPDGPIRRQAYRQFTLSNEVAGSGAESLGVVVLERWLTGKKARGNVRWNRNDTGRIQLEIERRIASLRIPLNERGMVEVEMGEIVRLPKTSSDGLPRALGLIANQSKPEAGYLSDAHLIALQGLGHSLKEHRDTAESFIPYLPLGAINEDVGPSSFGACIREVKQLLPVTVELMPISFFSEQELF